MNLQLLTICVSAIFCCVGYVSGQQTCHDSVVNSCGPLGGGAFSNCHSKYGAFEKTEFMEQVQLYARDHIQKSFQFLLMSSHFGNYEKNRAGFEKLYRKFSDDTWEKSIDLVKYIGKRGGNMDFHQKSAYENNDEIANFEMNELSSIGIALDMHKKLARGASLIHQDVTRRSEHDPEVASYVENNFVHQHSDVIRTLSGHANDLRSLINGQPDFSLSLYLFDEYLQKTI